MKRSLILGLTALTLSLVAAVGTSLPAFARATIAEGEAKLVPVPREFVPGPLTTVRGEVEIRDTGSALIVKGEAENMDPAKTYVSLAYTTPRHWPECLPTWAAAQLYTDVPGHLGGEPSRRWQVAGHEDSRRQHFAHAACLSTLSHVRHGQC